jgi:MEMO1 family protein
MSKMPMRQPVALNFYEEECRREQIESYLKGFQVPKEPTKLVGGIVPHAGWRYSGAVTAKVFKCIKEKAHPDTFVLFGAVHSLVQKSALFSRGAWATPLGEVAIDDKTANLILSSLKNEVRDNPIAHSNEHSIEVQLPFIKYFFPEAKIVPIMVVPDKSAILIGNKIAEIIRNSKVEIAVVGTTDLTHYGDAYGFAPWGYGSEAQSKMRENDEQIIHLITQLKTQEIIAEVMRNQNACGPGALAATVSAAKVLGTEKGVLIDYTTSFDVLPERQFRMAVGYAGIIF